MKTNLKLIYQSNILILALLGISLITVSLYLGGKDEMGHLIVTILAETGGLILVVGILHLMFEYRMREEMLHEISHTVLSNERIRQNGIVDCYDNSLDLGRFPEHLEQWKKAEHLTIGAHYSEGFFMNYSEIFEERCKHQRLTTVLLSDPHNLGCEYLKKIDPEVPNIEERVQRVIKLLTEEPNGCKNNMQVFLHPVVLRYLFISTEHCIWFVPMLNSKGRSHVPVIQLRKNSPLFNIFNDDIQRLLEQSKSAVS